MAVFDDFKKLDIRVGEIHEVRRVNGRIRMSSSINSFLMQTEFSLIIIFKTIKGEKIIPKINLKKQSITKEDL